mmetsp:Transcript_11777/g.29025  ORF Transcript_11777/g.29025 Transcript_11777/m.29025 type:complete len:223 (+) Transcript_11777:41-709(+)
MQFLFLATTQSAGLIYHFMGTKFPWQSPFILMAMSPHWTISRRILNQREELRTPSSLGSVQIIEHPNPLQTGNPGHLDCLWNVCISAFLCLCLIILWEAMCAHHIKLQKAKKFLLADACCCRTLVDLRNLRRSSLTILSKALMTPSPVFADASKYAQHSIAVASFKASFRFTFRCAFRSILFPTRTTGGNPSSCTSLSFLKNFCLTSIKLEGLVMSNTSTNA